MQIKVYRFSTAVGPLSGLWDRRPRGMKLPADTLIAAYESSELAALATAAESVGQDVMLRETLLLPNGNALHERLAGSRTPPWEDSTNTRRRFTDHLRRRKLLSIWLPAVWAPHQHLVLIDPSHPAFGAIEVSCRAAWQNRITQGPSHSRTLAPDHEPPDHRSTTGQLTEVS